LAVSQQKVLPNSRLSDDVGIWESSIVNEVLYLVFEVEAIIGLIAEFLVQVAIFIEVPSGRYGVRCGCGV